MDYWNTLHRLRPVLKRRLTPKRYRHSLLVARRAGQLASIHGADGYRAVLAGMLHDICHCDSPEWQLKYLESRGILLDDFTKGQPQLYHAVAGSALLRDLGVNDTRVLQAVRYHTTGRAGMSLLERVVYLADATSADRDYTGLEELRALADRDLDAAMAESLRHTLHMLAVRGAPVVRDSWEAYNWYNGATP